MEYAELLSMKHSARDDWSVGATPAERRKLQNRINQRTYRLRQLIKHPQKKNPSRWKKIGSLVDDRDQPTRRGNITPVLPRAPVILATQNCSIAPEGARDLLIQFEMTAYQSYRSRLPVADHLLTLVKVNVYRAFFENLAALGMDAGWMRADAVSPFCMLKPDSLVSTLPANLQPTAIQVQVPHHPWLDFFPHPRMRDHLILANDFDDDELCVDIMGFWNTNRPDAGLTIWGPPWIFQNWELSEGFMQKYRWAIQDCPELLRSTNYWRTLRGEKQLQSLRPLDMDDQDQNMRNEPMFDFM
ncbi:hypothetical protein ASPWEDRAFT_177600 [Aspergillus wentii DTO 134E9]|uniref:BZIP domain-containing protein n=1 Tax=Aspergillus wentii DTO 134E9 TaxID=1073089 RepID=A0A1L9R4M7_ASPWE|nr:uncharacterized protein ASPWEDRAFT_177600 [Aspergillus wentii DTO 134E9]KAI9927139.1 hypothetical protein MW887_003522 [Aspergillus wentii]OJJ29866.1 hypothetical protein ASPWEDRAFT_177600 [Aspergillus wentii DTO 134E9]